MTDGERMRDPRLGGFEYYLRQTYYDRYKRAGASELTLKHNLAVLNDAIRDYKQWLEAVENKQS